MSDTNLKDLPSILANNLKPETLPVEVVASHAAVIVPNGMTVQSLKKIRDEEKLVPDYRVSSTGTYDLNSFIDHVKRNLNKDTTVVFAMQPSIEHRGRINFDINAVMDYYPSGDDPTKAGARKNEVRYAAEQTKRMKKWLENDGSYMGITEFSHFIEDNMSDLVLMPQDWQPPFGKSVASPADMLTLSRGLEVRVNQTVRNTARVASGEVEVVFATENTRQDGTPLTVPEWFGIRIPIFVGSDPVVIPMRLRYHVMEGQISFAYVFFNFDQILEEEVEAQTAFVRENLPETHIIEGVFNY